jgi:hypothetical protein
MRRFENKRENDATDKDAAENETIAKSNKRS